MPPVRSNDKPSRPVEPALLLAALLSFAVSTPAVAGGGARNHKVAHAAVIGGRPAQEGAFPSLAYIVDFQGRIAYQCTGTVVAPSLILTAGHCAVNMRTGVARKPSGYRVVTGTVDPLAPNPSTSKVVGVIVYPGLKRRRDDGDAALLVLEAPVTAPPISLATAAESKRSGAGSPATIAGWGKISFEQKILTETLHSATTVVQGRRWCKRNARPFYAKNEICAIAPPTYATGGCEGDSGGPLLVTNPSTGELMQIGIAVHVYGRCSTRRPTVYTSTGSIARWVHTWIEAYKPPPAPPAPPAEPLPSQEPSPPPS